MKIYIVIEEYYYESSDIEGVFSTKEKALGKIEDMVRGSIGYVKNGEGDYRRMYENQEVGIIRIEEWDVD